MEFPHVKIVIVPADQPHVAVMNLLTEGISVGGVLPVGAEWINQETGHWLRTPTQEVIELQIRKWRALDSPAPRPAPLRWYIAKASDVPQDRAYRNAQVAHATENKVIHDMPLARELHKDMLRQERDPRMLKLDAQWMAATRAKDEAAIANIDAEKQVLLDSTDDPRILAATTVEELKVVTCESLVQEAVARGDITRAEPIAVDPVP